jgi:hypothetical protein
MTLFYKAELPQSPHLDPSDKTLYVHGISRGQKNSRNWWSWFYWVGLDPHDHQGDTSHRP